MLKILLTVLVLLLAYLVVQVPLWKYQQTAQRLQTDVQTLTVEAEPTLRLLEQLTERQQSLLKMIEYRRRHYPMSDVLLELTNLAPDNTWLKRLEHSDNQLILHGESKRASEFIERLERSPMFAEVDLLSPMVALSGSLYQQFYLSVTLGSRTDK
jgi:hypothetical protein